MSFYKTYYENTLKNKKGFQLVLGGTGLGKTSGIIETVINNSEPQKRFFYVANRLQLLNEMVASIEETNKNLIEEGKSPIRFCLQRKDEDILKDLAKNDFEKLTQNSTIIKYATELEKTYKTNLKSLIKTFEFVKENTSLSNNSESSEFLREKVSKIFNFFKGIIREAQTNAKDFQEILENPTIKFLFPYLDFKNNPTEKRIFIVSLQKAFYGFFDGKQVVNIYKLENDKEKDEQNIIFLDEFDFLENDLLSQICKDTVIEQPFAFIKNFYDVLNEYKLPREQFLENHTELRKELEEIVKLVKPLAKEYKIPFPQINHFLCNDKVLKGTSIFQTRYSISNYKIYLNHQRTDKKGKRIKSFYLEQAQEKNKNYTKTYALLNVVNQVTSAIIRIFKELEFSQPEVYRALAEHCFGASDKYKQTLKLTRQYPFRRKSVSTNESKVYYNGFGLYEIYNFGYPTDNEEVELKYYAIFSTPESILLRLAKNNLVFGLSATAEIDRYVKNFDLNWLNNELRITDKERKLKEHLYYEVTDVEKNIIQNANQKKFEVRQNKLIIEKADENSLSENLQERLENIIQTHTDIFGEGNKTKYRKKRLAHFFATLEKVMQSNEIAHHLLFFYSYDQILKILEKGDIETTKETLVSIQKIASPLSNLFSLEYQRKTCYVIFLNAAQGKDIAKFEENKEAYYQLFWENKPVLLVTTYASAGNGVNLFYYKDKSKNVKLDFANIHLLDRPFYFFSPIDYEKDTEQGKTEKIKTNIYYLAKAEKNKLIDENQFKIYLNKIRSITDFNAFYLKTNDGLCNRVAVYIQAIGRIERVWAKMNDQTIHLDREVYNDLEDFATQTEDYLQVLNFEKNKPYFSHNVNELFNYIIANQPKRKQSLTLVQWEGLKAIDDKCRERLQILLDDLEKVRKNKLSQEKLLQIRREWQSLRTLALKQDFAKFTEMGIEENGEKTVIKVKRKEIEALEKYSAIFQIDLYDHRNKCLWIQAQTQNVVPYHANPNSSFCAWDLDSAFKNIRNNQILKNYFDFHRYEQGFSGKGTYFTPYFYQCILTGAIGEEVVKAIFEYEKIDIGEDEIPNQLFELIDLKIKNTNWYIDAKNYSEQTIAHFGLGETDRFFHPKLNSESFIQRAKDKLALISDFHQDKENCKIIFINTFGEGNERPINYYDENFNEVGKSFDKAKIIIVQGMLKREKPAKDEATNYTADFKHFISELKQRYNG